MTPRQLKVFTGAGSGSFDTDSLGNTWLAGDAFHANHVHVDCYYIPSGSGNTVGGVLTWRGITLDEPVLAKAFVFAAVFHDAADAERRTILVEFGRRDDSFPYDYDAAGGVVGSEGSTPYPTQHYVVGTVLPPNSGIPNTPFAAVDGYQVWIAIRQLDTSGNAGTPTSVSATAPADFTAIYDDGRDGFYYRYDTSGPTDFTVPYTVSPGTVSGNILDRFVLSAPPAYVPPAMPPQNIPRKECAPKSQVSGGGKGNFGCNTGGVGWVSSYAGPYGTVPADVSRDPGRRFDVVGLALPFGDIADPEQHHGERTAFAAGAFVDAIGRGSARLLLDHDEQIAIASQADGTLAFWEDATGLHFGANLPQSKLGVLTLNGIANGVIRHCCVNPQDLEGEWQDDVKVTKRVGRFDLSLMVRGRPSFPATSVEVNREKTAGFLWRQIQKAAQTEPATDRPLA